VFKVKDIITQEEYAAKINRDNKDESLLEIEYNCMCHFQGQFGFPKSYFFGREISPDRTIIFIILIMDLFGVTVENQFVKNKKLMSIPSIINIGLQILTRLEVMHNLGYVHRDIKPENFLFGLNHKQGIVHLIDFGLSKRYKNSHGQHVPFRTDKSLIGLNLFNS
jgi:serine/threonine protein kinase